jgi:hypothetical protein
VTAHVLSYLGFADSQELATETRYQVQGLIKPKNSLSAQGWTLLFHPDEELLTGQIFAVIAPAVLLGRISVLRRDKALPKLDPSTKQDPKTSTLLAIDVSPGRGRFSAWGRRSSTPTRTIEEASKWCQAYRRRRASAHCRKWKHSERSRGAAEVT